MRSFIIIAIAALLIGCNSDQEETSTKGNLHIFIPESIEPVMVDEINRFLELYSQNGAKITYTVTTSETAAQLFVKDSSRIGFLTRKLTQAEKEEVKSVSPDFNEIIIAYDGVVAVVNQRNKIRNMTTTELQKILDGRITKWNQVAGGKSIPGKIRVFYHDSSDLTRYLLPRLGLKEGIKINITNTQTDAQTLGAVDKDQLSLGLVALSWYDSTIYTARFLNLGRTDADTDTSFAPPAETKGGFFSPHPANIFRNYYPLKRAIYMYTRGKLDLAGGFGTYVATAEGQKLMLDRGVLPGTQRIKLRADQPF